MARQANCPACAAPVEFLCRTSLVAVCPSCQTVVARGDKKLEDHGRVADIVETQSPLKLGLRGRFRTKPFYVIGRTQFQHSAGGVWDEWYCAFPNGKWGWLAEAQGRFYITFEAQIPSDQLPSAEDIRDGQVLQLGDQRYTIAEVGEAQTAGAQGEMPVDVVPNATHPFADLYGEDERFATIDYSAGKPHVFVGWEVSFDELGIKDTKPGATESKKVAALKVSCPHCAGMFELKAPDQAQRVVCQFCSSMLDCTQGNLQFLSTLLPTTKPIIKLGTKGTLRGIEFTVIGFMQRSVTYDGTKYFWTEYLLYEPKTGFRWLVNSDSHWSFVEPLSPSQVKDDRTTVRYDGKTFKIFQEAMARVEYVLGEFYWKVEVGEAVLCRDLICPPFVMSFERTSSGSVEPDKQGRRSKVKAGETTISLGTYVPHEELEEAFGVKPLPRGWQVAPNQPNPMSNEVYLKWLIFLLAFVILYGFASIIGKEPDEWLLVWACVVASIVPVVGTFVNANFNQRRWAESDFSS